MEIVRPTLTKGWALWSKDIIVLISPDSYAGPQAWVDAYHQDQLPSGVEALPRKSGALQGAVAIDNALHHNFRSLHMLYEGINGQLSNLDLLNTATHVARSQMGMAVAIQGMWTHRDTYADRLQTLLRGVVSQAVGQASGPHSGFVSYHVDAMTLQAVENGPEDEMAMGRVVESIFRSLNNILEHFHQSFFLYMLMHPDRFVSIGTYLPSAMLVAASFSIMAIALWIFAGSPASRDKKAIDSRSPENVSNLIKANVEPSSDSVESKEIADSDAESEEAEPSMILVSHGNKRALVPKQDLATTDRDILLPLVVVLVAHALGLIPLYLFTHSGALVSPSLII